MDVNSQLCSSTIYVAEYLDSDHLDLIEKDASSFHNLENCQAALLQSGKHDFPIIPLVNIQEFVQQLQNIRNMQNPHIRNEDFSKDIDFAHSIFIDNGYNDYNENDKNTPFIKMFFRGPEVSPYSRYRSGRKIKLTFTLPGFDKFYHK